MNFKLMDILLKLEMELQQKAKKSFLKLFSRKNAQSSYFEKYKKEIIDYLESELHLHALGYKNIISEFGFEKAKNIESTEEFMEILDSEEYKEFKENLLAGYKKASSISNFNGLEVTLRNIAYNLSYMKELTEKDFYKEVKGIKNFKIVTC